MDPRGGLTHCASGCVPRRPCGRVSAAIAEAVALTQASLAAGERMTFVVDNLGTVNRARAILADVQKRPKDVPTLLRAAEWFEALDDDQMTGDAPPGEHHHDPLEDDENNGRGRALRGPSAPKTH